MFEIPTSNIHEFSHVGKRYTWALSTSLIHSLYWLSCNAVHYSHLNCLQVSDNLEKKEAVLSEVLSAANLDPVSFNQVSHQLEVCSLCPPLMTGKGWDNLGLEESLVRKG